MVTKEGIGTGIMCTTTHLSMFHHGEKKRIKLCTLQMDAGQPYSNLIRLHELRNAIIANTGIISHYLCCIGVFVKLAIKNSLAHYLRFYYLKRADRAPVTRTF